MTSEAAAPARLIGVFAAFVGVAPLVMLPGGFEPANLPQSAFVQAGALALLLAALASRLAVPPPWRAGPIGPPLTAFLAWAALSLVWAVNRREAFQTWAHWGACGLVYLLLWTVSGRTSVRPVLAALFASGTLVAVLGLLQHIAGVTWVPQAFPPAATFMNRNVAAPFVVGTLPLGYGLSAGVSPRVRLGCTVSMALMGGYVFHAFTKAGWLALFVQSLVFLVLFLRRRPSEKPAWRFVAAGLAVYIALIPLGPRGGLAPAVEAVAGTLRSSHLVGPDRPLQELTENERVNSIRVRRAIWLNTAAMVRDRPLLGTGLGNHEVLYPAYARRWAEDPGFGIEAQLDFVHNDYLQVLAELGLVGAGLGAWLLWTVATVARRALAKGSAQELAIVVGLIALFVDAFVSFPFQRALPPLVFAVYLAALSPPSNPIGRLRSRGPGMVLAAAALLAALWTHGRILAADRHVWRARQAEAGSDWTVAGAEAQAASRYDRGRKEAAFVLGTAYLATGRPAESAAVLRPLTRRYPYDLHAWANLALAEEALGRWDAALAAQDRVAAVLPSAPDVHAARGRLLERMGRADEAGQAYARALAQDPGNARYHYRAGVAALVGGRHQEAARALAEAVRLQPDLAEAHKGLGVVLYQFLGRKDEGREHLRRALELDPQIKDAPRMRAMLEAP